MLTLHTSTPTTAAKPIASKFIYKMPFRSVLLENRNKIEISFKYTRFCLLFKFSSGFSGFIEEQVSVKQSMLIIMTAHLDN